MIVTTDVNTDSDSSTLSANGLPNVDPSALVWADDEGAVTDAIEDAASGETDAEDADEEATPEEPAMGPVPYKRFHESRKELASAKAELAQVKAEHAVLVAQQKQILEHLQALQAKQGNAVQGNVESEEDPDLLDPYEQTLAKVMKELEDLKGWKQSTAQEAATKQHLQQLTSDWEAAKKQYPHAEHAAEWVFNLLEKDHSMSVQDAAKRVHDILAKQFGGSGTKVAVAVSQTKPPASVRPSPKGSSNFVPRQEFKNLDEATAAFLKTLK